jgi:hypothetical protein
LRGSPPVAHDVVWFSSGLPPRNEGLRHPPDPPTVQEVIAVMRAAPAIASTGCGCAV